VSRDDRKILTVFVPVFGLSPYLDSCLASLKEFEQVLDVVVLEDFPSEISNRQILNEYGFRHIMHQANLGLVSNFNFARDYAETPFFLIIGPDDELVGDFFALTNVLEDFVASKTLFYLETEVIDENGAPFNSLRERMKFLISSVAGKSPKSQLRSLMIGYWPFSPGVVWPTKGRGLRYRSQFMLVADFCLLAEHLLDGFVLKKATSKSVLRYRRHTRSISGDKNAWKKTRAEEIALYKFLQEPMFEKRYLSAFFFSFLQPTSRIFFLLRRIGSMLSERQR
jgi:glycosyltransferase involved in cell wall biosynthesis